MQFHKAPDPESQNQEFEPWELDAVDAVVRTFVKARWEGASPDVEDLKQESWFRWLKVRRRFSEERGANRRTFLGRVLINFLRDLQRQQQTDKRKASHHALSLDVASDGESSGLADFLESDDVTHDPSQAAEHNDLARRIAQATETLSAREQSIVEGLEQGKTVTSLSWELGVSRVTVHKDIGHIRRIFSDEGLREFLE